MPIDHDRQRRIEELYHAALELPEGQRRAFLSDSCQGDDELLGDVTSLLDFAGAAKRLMNESVSAAGTEPFEALPGTCLGPFEILERIGAGGMGEVYRARDTKLEREVAVKVLPRELAHDRDSLERFEREARLLAALDHPHIASIHGLYEEGDRRLLVMELVDGPTLSRRLQRGPLPVQEALEVGRQIADALEAAHAEGIVHRDLKPANIMLTRRARVKVLDFGIARALERGAAAHARSGTTATLTGTGIVLGTAPYMSPEQARGEDVDQMTDIWSFGCVLYELLTGRRAFPGRTASDAMAAVLEREPDWSVLPANSGPIVRSLIRQCLKKSRAQRLHAAADARIQIEEALTGGDATEETTGHRAVHRWRIAFFVLAAFSVTGLAILGQSRLARSPAPQPIRRYAIDLPKEASLAYDFDYPPSLAVSRSGSAIAFVADVGNERSLFFRALDEEEARRLKGTGAARAPFFSPDGKWIAFFASGTLKKVSVRGGAPVALAHAPRGMGGAWSKEGWIVYAPSEASGLMWVAEDGGGSEAFSRVDLNAGEEAHLSPVLLPDEKTAVFTVWTGARNTDARLAAKSRSDPLHRVILDGGSHAQLLPPHHLVYGRGRELLGVEFDTTAGRVEGVPFRVFEEVHDTPGMRAPLYALSREGDLIYAPASGAPEPGRIVWLDRSGRVTQEIEAGATYDLPRLSPDGTRISYHRASPDYDVWVRDLERGTRQRLTQHRGWDGFAVWSPDSARVAFSSTRHGSRTVLQRAADASSAATQMLPPGNSRWPTAWSPDGRWLAYNEEAPDTGMDIWLFDIERQRSRAFLRTRFREGWARYSPDGAWIAYHSDETGRYEVYLQRLHEPPQRIQVSTSGGMVPLWSPSGREIVYTNGDEVLAAEVQLGDHTLVGPPVALFRSDNTFVNDVHPDSGWLLATQQPIAAPLRKLRVILGWREVLRQLSSPT